MREVFRGCRHERARLLRTNSGVERDFPLSASKRPSFVLPASALFMTWYEAPGH